MRSFKGQGLPEHWVGQVTERGFRIEIFSKTRLKGGQTGSQVWESKRWEDPGSAMGGQPWKPGQVTSPSPHSQSKVGVGRPDGWRNSEIKQTPEGSQSHHARHAGRPAGAEAVNGGRSRRGETLPVPGFCSSAHSRCSGARGALRASRGLPCGLSYEVGPWGALML